MLRTRSSFKWIATNGRGIIIAVGLVCGRDRDWKDDREIESSWKMEENLI